MIPIALSELAAKAWKPIACILAMALVLGGVAFYGFRQGQDSRQPEIDKLTASVAGLKAQNSAMAAAAVRQNQENEKLKQQAELAKQLADGALDEMRRTQDRLDKAKSDFEKKLSDAAKTPGCSMLKELSCPAVPFPY